jgi:ferredoxin
MRVWIDQDCCTGAGLCVDHCPELFIVLEDGIGYVHEGRSVISDPQHPSVVVPRRYEQAAIDAVERCPGECIYVEPDHEASSPITGLAEAAAVVDAEVIDN